MRGAISKAEKPFLVLLSAVLLLAGLSACSTTGAPAAALEADANLAQQWRQAVSSATDDYARLMGTIQLAELELVDTPAEELADASVLADLSQRIEAASLTELPLLMSGEDILADPAALREQISYYQGLGQDYVDKAVAVYGGIKALWESDIAKPDEDIVIDASAADSARAAADSSSAASPALFFPASAAAPLSAEYSKGQATMLTAAAGDDPPVGDTHSASATGGFIVFGGWIKLYDDDVPKGTMGHEFYIAFGGLGVGGWNAKNGHLNLVQGYSWQTLYSNAKSASVLVVGGDETTIKIFDSKSNCLAFAKFDGAPTCPFALAGGSVKVEG